MISGSRLVQSPLSFTVPVCSNAVRTAGVSSATRSLTRQVMHQAAVKSTNTGLPAAAAWVMRCAREALPALEADALRRPA